MSEPVKPRRRKTADVLLAQYAQSRDRRDALRSSRDGCLCERHEGATLTGAPCWKAARTWDHDVAWDGCPTGRTRFYFDPAPSEWCATCQRRQSLTEQLREAVRAHAASKRALLQRGRALARVSPAPPARQG